MSALTPAAVPSAGLGKSAVTCICHYGVIQNWPHGLTSPLLSPSSPLSPPNPSNRRWLDSLHPFLSFPEGHVLAITQEVVALVFRVCREPSELQQPREARVTILIL